MEIDIEIEEIIDTIFDFHDKNLEGKIDSIIEKCNRPRAKDLKLLEEVSSDLFWIDDNLTKVVDKLKQFKK